VTVEIHVFLAVHAIDGDQNPDENQKMTAKHATTSIKK